MIKKQNISLEKVVIVSFLVDLSDVAINSLVAFFSGSATMWAQAFEGISDAISSGFLLVGVRKSKKPANYEHPYGYGREIYFWSFLSGLIAIGITATLSIYWGWKQIVGPSLVEHLLLAYLALIIGIFTNGYAVYLSYQRILGHYKFSQFLRVFKKSAQIETKTAFVQDVMGTLASILGLTALIIFGMTGDSRFDGIGAIATGVLLAIIALIILKNAKDLLIGKSAGIEVEKEIIKAVFGFPRVKEILDLKTLLIGPKRLLINIEVNLKDELRTDEIEDLIDKIEKNIRDKIPHKAHIQIELEG